LEKNGQNLDVWEQGKDVREKQFADDGLAMIPDFEEKQSNSKLALQFFDQLKALHGF